MRTLASPASIEVIIKHSRFIANAARVDKQAETLAFYGPGGWTTNTGSTTTANLAAQPAGRFSQP